jgi:hypothetical protein
MKRVLVLAGCIVGVLLIAALIWFVFFDTDGRPYRELPFAVYRDSSVLKQTAILPTMDAEMPKGKNAIWCASFQLAWNHLATDALHESPVVANAEKMVRQLNESKFYEGDLPNGCYYATAGFGHDGIVEKIRDEMERRFKTKPTIELVRLPTTCCHAIDEAHGGASKSPTDKCFKAVPPSDPEQQVVAYGYLEVGIPFTVPYYEYPREFLFADGRGVKTSVTAFGTWPSGGVVCREEVREQAKVLHWKRGIGEGKGDEFVIDPCRASSPNQVIVACVRPKETLRKTWEYVAELMADYPRQKDARERMGIGDLLLVPDMAWDVTHHFLELEGHDKRLKNKGFDGLYLAGAVQAIRFRLDRNGADLRSWSAAAVKAVPRDFIFDRPFAIFIRKRESSTPFFAMYVDNAELLNKAAEKKTP